MKRIFLTHKIRAEIGESVQTSRSSNEREISLFKVRHEARVFMGNAKFDALVTVE